MEVDLLRTFVEVAEARSYSRAAESLHFVQSTLSRQVGRLEEEAGVRLLERSGRHVECTEAGRLLLPLARAIVARTDDALALLREMAGREPNVVRFGAVPSVMTFTLTPILVSFLATYPSVTVDLSEKDDTELEEGVIRGELDCAVVTLWDTKRVASRHLLTEEILLLVPRDHKLANQETIPLRLLAGESTLLPRAGMNVSNVYVDALRRAGVSLNASYRTSYPEFTKALVRRGLGVAPMPKSQCAPATLEGIVAIPFEKPIYRDLALIYPRDRPLSSGTRSLAVHIRAMLAGGRQVATSTPASMSRPDSASLAAFNAKMEGLVRGLMTPAKVTFNKATLASPKAVGVKKVLYLTLFTASHSMSQVHEQLQLAGDVLSWEVSMVDGRLDPVVMTEALITALSTKVDAVICHAVDAKKILDPLRALKSAGIPAIGFACGNREDLYRCEGTLGPDGWVKEGYQAFAAGYIAAGGAKGVPVRIIRLDQPGVEIAEGRNTGFDQAVAEAKDAGADVEVLAKIDYMLADEMTAFPTAFTRMVVKAVEQHPQYNVMWSSTDKGLNLVRGELLSAGLYDPSKIWCAVDCQPEAFADIHAGGAIKCTIGSPNSWSAWVMMNDLNRVFSGLQPLGAKVCGYPQYLVTKDNSEPPPAGQQVPWDSYMEPEIQAGFTRIWTGASRLTGTKNGRRVAGNASARSAR
jgi:DNA-binding transcriptional LysR family regulator/ABC-type sugar transport system substrate-binding protein